MSRAASLVRGTFLAQKLILLVIFSTPLTRPTEQLRTRLCGQIGRTLTVNAVPLGTSAASLVRGIPLAQKFLLLVVFSVSLTRPTE